MSATRRREVRFDGQRLSADGAGSGRPFEIDARCLDGKTVTGAYAHVCASPDASAAVPFDAPEVQQARRDALAWWIPMLGDSLICLSTLALDASTYGGAITVARDPSRFGDDPFARIFRGTVVETDIFAPVEPPPGPIMERYAGAPWPAEGFAS